MLVGCLRFWYFDDMIRKVIDGISVWANRLLSFVGKLVLILHVLPFMQLHFFSYF